MTKQEAQILMNRFGETATPFLFIIDFDAKSPLVLPLDKVDERKILYAVEGHTNHTAEFSESESFEFSFVPVSMPRYEEAFKLVQKHIGHGDSFLLNLTMPSKVETKLSLKDIFSMSKARYKLLYKDKFVVFSPETFVKTEGRKISSYPMKGTMDANLPNARETLLNNRKELAEHYTIVDLIRNDIGMVARDVKVDRFQYIEKIKTHKHELLQMSSVISGMLPEDFHKRLGDIMFTMLPAGSITGAPKQKTIEVIKKAEKYDRNFYTGIFGIFDGRDINSGVMIRYIENTNEGMVYKSGGGITALSKINEEYQELIDKIYLPIE